MNFAKGGLDGQVNKVIDQAGESRNMLKPISE